MAPATPLRVGIVPYLNMLPLVHGLDRLADDPTDGPAPRIVPVPPSRMTEMLDRGELDLGMAPIGAMLERPQWRVVGRSMIGSTGPVLSVLVAGVGQPAGWQRLRPDSHSRSSNVLARVILKNLYGLEPEAAEPLPMQGWTPPAPGEPEEQATAHVMIGTRALRWRDRWTQERGTTIDLGEAWDRLTGLPFVYAAWVVRPGVDPQAVHLEAWMERFEELKARNLARLDELLAQQDLSEEGIDVETARRYLTEHIRFDLTDAAKEGMARFAEEARRL